jgi:hypothetical protein
MGLTVIQQRRFSALLAAFAGVGMLSAHASPPSISSLEREAQAEFAQAGLAMRERLDRVAAGDLIGARIAAHDVQSHRYRYLDLTREINRLHPQAAAFPSVAAPRDPFMPDGSFLAESAPTATQMVAKAADARTAGPGYRSWDMYRPRELGEAAASGDSKSGQVMRATSAATPREEARDLYAADTTRPATSDRRAPADEMPLRTSSGDTPRQPFLVYRERLPGSESRE